MTQIRLSALAWGLVLMWGALAPRGLMAAEFSDEATALPYAPDAFQLEFAPHFRSLQYNSYSPLKSLAAFYLKEMAARGWEHDESKAKVEKELIELTFKHGDTEAEIEIKQGSRDVRVSFDTEGMKFTGIHDPVKLAAAGLPVPRSLLFFQKEMTFPEGVKDLSYSGDRCIFKLPAMTLQDNFEYFSRAVVGKGFKESRKPLLSDSRRYTEFKKGTVQVSVNTFTDGAGSRTVLEYKDEAKVTPKPPLPAVATLPIKGAEVLGGNDAPIPAANATPVDVATNKGSASVNYNGKVYTFPHVAGFQTKDRPGSTMLVFSSKPIPLNRMQSLIVTKKDFAFHDLYENSSPERLVVQLGDYLGFTFNLSNVVVGNSIDNPVNELKVEGGRVKGTLKMPAREVFKGEPLSFSVTADAVIMTPTTRIKGPADKAETSDLLQDSPVPFPLNTQTVSREGSKFRKTYSATVGMPREEVAAFYRKALAEKGWKLAAEAAGEPIHFKNDTAELSVTLEPKGDKTAIKVLTRDIALAKAEGILPEAGKGRLVLANAHNVAIVYTIGKTDYPLKPGQGGRDFKQALNYSIAPASYTVVIKVPGQPQQTEQIELTAGSTWAVVVLPTGACMPMQLY